MIVFEPQKFLSEIRRNGIKSKDKNAKFKINYLMTDLIINSKYHKNKIIDMVEDLASDFFEGLPSELINKEIEEIYDNVKAQVNEQECAEKFKKKVITLYESEMETIASLKDVKLMKLAFATLVLHKFTGQFYVNGKEKYYTAVKSCEADAYRIAGLENNISGTTKKKLWKTLSEMDLVKYYIKTNPAWRFYPNWIAMTLLTVPFNVDIQNDQSSEKIYKKINNYDDVLLYLDFWLKKDGFVECVDCGCPLRETSSTKRLCSNCASERKKASDNARYMKKLELA